MLVSFLSWDLKYTGLVTNLGLVPFVPSGTSLRFGRSKTHNEKASTAQDPLGVGVRTATRHLKTLLIKHLFQINHIPQLLAHYHSLKVKDMQHKF